MAANAVVERLEELNSTNPPNVTSADFEDLIRLAKGQKPEGTADQGVGARVSESPVHNPSRRPKASSPSRSRSSSSRSRSSSARKSSSRSKAAKKK